MRRPRCVWDRGPEMRRLAGALCIVVLLVSGCSEPDGRRLPGSGMSYYDAVAHAKLQLPEGAEVVKFSAAVGFQASNYDFLLLMPCEAIGDFATANGLTTPRRSDPFTEFGYLQQVREMHGWLRHAGPLLKARGTGGTYERSLGVPAQEVQRGGSCNVVHVGLQD